MVKMHMLKSVTNTINTSFIIESSKGLIIFDGGFEEESENLYSAIRALGGKVSAWFLTHPHTDHIEAFRAVIKNHPDATPEALYFNFLPLYVFDKYFSEADRENGNYVRGFYEDVKSLNTVTVHKDDVFHFGNVTVTVLQEPDEMINVNIHNNSSVVYRLETENSSVMFFGDLGIEGGEKLLSAVTPERLHADYCQMAHHGQSGVSKKVYEAVKPSYCLWCTPTWLWDNMGAEGYDTGVYKTVIVRGWMSEIGIKKHYIMQEGPHTIEL